MKFFSANASHPKLGNNLVKVVGAFLIAFLAFAIFDLLLIATRSGGSFAFGRWPQRLRALRSGRKVAPRQVRGADVTPGRWEGPFDWPAVAVHLALLHTGQVLVLDRPLEDGDIAAWVWNPADGSIVPAPNNLSNVFCAGHATLSDGRLLLVGGHADDFFGIPDGTIFDPVVRLWTRAGAMAYPRWYPTATTLPDGRVLAVSGSWAGPGDNVDIPEVYDPRTDAWTSLPNASLFLPLYPYMFVLPDGRVLQAGSDEAATNTWSLDVATQTWTLVDPVPADGGSAAMYLPGKVIKSGTAGDVDADATPAAATTYVFDATNPSPRWRQTAPMNFARSYHNLTILPDGDVLATGGERSTDGWDEDQAVFAAEIWSPITETWTTMPSMRVPRVYHSTALLLPDGRVLVAGSGRWNSGIDEFSAEIFSPSYLFQGPRPSIISAPSTIEYGAEFVVGTSDADISSVTLVRPGAVTHAFNQDQRFLQLDFEIVEGGGLSVHAPANSNLAPPGYYMLFILNSNGVPSVASFVQIR